MRSGPKTGARVLVLVDLIQDVDVLLPVLLGLQADTDLTPAIYVSRWLSRESPRTQALLALHRLPFRWVRRAQVIEGRSPSLKHMMALLTAAESSHPAHAAGFSLALRAKAAGLATYTLQHGLENVGLRGSEAACTFASDSVFCWFPRDRTPAEMNPATRPKLIHVGRPSSGCNPPRGPAEFDVGVFENLHAPRYSDAERSRFFAGLGLMASSGARVLLRPHPAAGHGGLVARALASSPRMIVQDPVGIRSEPVGVSRTIAACARIITTPSTVALDAALIGRPVALALEGGAAFEGLPVLPDPEAWLMFAHGPSDPLANTRFLRANLMSGDATPRILRRIKHDLGQKGLAPSG